MTAYLVHVSVALILFYGIYYLFLKTETSFRLARAYLIFPLLVSVLAPVLDAQRLVSIFITDTDVVYEYWLPDLTTTSIQVKENESPNLFWSIIVAIYLLGVAVSLIRLVNPFFQLKKIIERSKMKRDGEGWYYLQEDSKGSFSFFNYVFIGSKSWHSEEDRQSILMHERAHAKHWHSADIMPVQLIGTLVWFNPIIYWYRNTLEQLHEYEADLIASRNKTEGYCELLVKDVLESAQFSLANHFNKSLTLKRINMIKSVKRKMTGSKKLALVGAVLLIVIVMACEEKALTDIKRAAGQSVVLTEYPKEVQDALKMIKSKNPDANLQVYGVVKTRDLEQIDLDGKIATMLFRENDPDYKVYVILGLDDVNFAASNLFEMKDGQKIYKLVQEPASPVNGIGALYNQIATNLKYPEEAKMKGIEGRVFIKFMVDEKGKLSNFQIIRGIGTGCDEEAVRVMGLSPNWKPGMQDGLPVKSTFNMSVNFKLDAGKED